MVLGFQVPSLTAWGFALRCSDPCQILTDASAAWLRCSNRTVKEVNDLLSMLQRTNLKCGAQFVKEQAT
jgi:hypothetical protein